MTHEERANQILSGFSWAYRGDGLPMKFIMDHLRIVESETIERCARVTENYTASIPTTWDIAAQIRALKKD